MTPVATLAMMLGGIGFFELLIIAALLLGFVGFVFLIVFIAVKLGQTSR